MKDDIDGEGGAVTRDKHFDWCSEKQGGCSKVVDCRLCNIEEWRDNIVELGGPLMVKEHMAQCDKVAERVGQRVESILKLQKDLFVSELNGMKSALELLVRELKETNGKHG